MKINSPICNNWTGLKLIYTMSKERGVDWNIVLGISRAESRLLTDFKPYHCKSTNNPAGLKWIKLDSGDTIKGPMPDENRCRLASYPTIWEGFKSLINTIHLGYVDQGCNSLECIAYRYVGDPNVSERTRKDRVLYFMNWK